MTEEAFIRIACTAMAVVGVAILAATLGGYLGVWAAGAVLLVCGAAVCIPMWNRHFQHVADGREATKFRPEQPKKASEESPY